MRNQASQRWFFLFLNRVYSQLLEHSELHDPDTSIPILDVIKDHALQGLRAIDRSDDAALLRAADGITDAYCALP